MTDPIYRGRYRGKKYKRKVKPLGMPDSLGRMDIGQVRPRSKVGNLLKEKAMKDPLAEFAKSQRDDEDALEEQIRSDISKIRYVPSVPGAGSGWSAAKRSAASKKGWETRRRRSAGARPASEPIGRIKIRKPRGISGDFPEFTRQIPRNNAPKTSKKDDVMIGLRLRHREMAMKLSPSDQDKFVSLVADSNIPPEKAFRMIERGRS